MPAKPKNDLVPDVMLLTPDLGKVICTKYDNKIYFGSCGSQTNSIVQPSGSIFPTLRHHIEASSRGV